MKKIFLVVLLIASQIFSQSFYNSRSYSRTIFFPEGHLFPINFSDPLEPKIGTQFYLDDKSLELNIGASKDIIHHRFDYWNKVGFGIEFFNWTLLNREAEFRFPVIAADYLFGGYFVYYHNGYKIDWANRIRITHISAHLSDGAYSNQLSQWKGNRPFTYSREFVQWTSTFIHKNIKLNFDALYLFHSIPEWKYNTIFGFGTETILIGFPEIFTKIFSGFDLKFQKVRGDKFETNKNFSTGFIFGNEELPHLRIAYQFYHGYNFHGQFFNQKLKQSFINLSLVL
ncbi:MAG: hypothetical protein N3F03_06165 [Ignavibacteria bacterium]|nr:hypothetical protein [Ignavibacteria bacterium]